jgi:hypothetical protein
MDSLFSFPVGLFHPLQHAGLSRRSTNSRYPVQVNFRASKPTPIVFLYQMEMFGDDGHESVKFGSGEIFFMQPWKASCPG